MSVYALLRQAIISLPVQASARHCGNMLPTVCHTLVFLLQTLACSVRVCERSRWCLRPTVLQQ